MKKVCTFLFIIAGSWQILIAQPLNRQTPVTMIQTAEKAMAQHNYYQALEWYGKAHTANKDADLLLTMADLNLKLRDYQSAAQYFEDYFKAAGSNARSDKRYDYGLTLKRLGKYKMAIGQLEQAAKGSKHHANMIRAVEGARMAMISKPDEMVTVTNVGNSINTKNSEYSPMMVQDELFYVSLLENQIVELNKENKSGFGTKILTAKKSGDGWSQPVQLNENINRPGYFNSNVSISSDGKEMLFTRQLLSDGNKLLESKLYRSIKVNESGDWAPAQEVHNFNENHLVKSPSFGELYGKKVIFFASDKAGGLGGYDLYYATDAGQGNYKAPVNLGPQINTDGDEDTPFYQNGKLYFSSNGWPGFGGYDIFKANWKGDVWETPENLGLPFNSSVDDLDFMMLESGSQGYLASNRPDPQAQSLKSKTCCNDIYFVNIEKEVIIADLLAKVFDKNAGTGLNGALVKLIPQGNTSEDMQKNSLAKNSEYKFELANDQEYLLIASAENYRSDSLIFNTRNLAASKTFVKSLNLIPIPIPKPEPEYITITREEAITLNNIYYDYNDDKITATAEPDLQLLYEILTENPAITKIELSSHTDARGGADFNQKLSQRRAASARQWILNKGINPDRIVAKGYGKSEPKTVSPDLHAIYPFLAAGTLLTLEFTNNLPHKEQREIAFQINRRTEFKILEGPTSIKIEEKRLKN